MKLLMPLWDQCSKPPAILLMLGGGALFIAALTTDLRDWFQERSSIIELGAVVVVALATVSYALYTRDLILKTRQQRRPYVFLEVVRRGALLDTALRNAGDRGAENVRVKVQRDVVVGDSRGFVGWPLFQTVVPFLPPGRAVTQTVAHFPSIQGALSQLAPAQRVVRYSVAYDDGPDHYEHVCSYDLSFLLPAGEEQFPLAGDEVALLRCEVQEWKKWQSRLLEGMQENLRSIAGSLSVLSGGRRF